MRFWIYFKGDYNGQLVVGYRYEIGDDITSLTYSNYASCETNSTQCPWQRIEVPLSFVLQKPTEIIIGVTTGANRDAIMALDDVSYTPQCVQYNGTTPTRPTVTPYTGPPTTTTEPPTTTPYTGPPTTTTSGPSTTSTEPPTTTPYTGPPTTTTTGPTTTTTTPRECVGYTCLNGGVCKPSTTEVGKPMCECPSGYSGAQCENKSKSNLGAILGGVFGALAVIALLLLGYKFVLPKIRSSSSTDASSRLLDMPIGPITNPAYSETATSDA